MTRLFITLVASLATAAALTVGGDAREAATTAFLCPKNPAASPPTRWVKNYPPGSFRGSTWCNDGATAALTLNASPANHKVPAR